MTDIRGKRTLITGAAKGMGREMALQFGDLGADLILVDIDEENLDETVRQVESAGGRAEAFVCDLGDRSAIEELRRDVHASIGNVEILVNNAGVVDGGRYEDLQEEADELMLDVNVGAVHWMTKTFLPDLKRGRDTHLVQMASAAGFIGLPYQAVYCASKWFVIGLSEALRIELKKEDCDHVGLSIACPSLVDTGMFEGSDPPLLSPLLEPEYVAEQVTEAVDEETLYVLEPWSTRLAPLLYALLPADVTDALGDLLGVTEIMHGWEGRDSA